jgi:hypothetical protein
VEIECHAQAARREPEGAVPLREALGQRRQLNHVVLEGSMKYEVLWSDIIRGSVVVEAESAVEAIGKAIQQVDAMLKDMDLSHGDDLKTISVA